MGDEQVLIDEVAASEPVFDGAHPFNDPRVPIEERQSGRPLAAHQPMQDEEAAGLPGIDAIEADATAVHHRKAVHGDPLEDDRPTRPRVPLRITVGASGQRPGCLLNPLRLDLSDATRPEAIRLDELCGHHPRGTGAGEH